MRELPELKPGDTISAAWLNGLRDLWLQCRTWLDAGSGLMGAMGPGGGGLARRRKLERWAKITSLSAGSTYNVTEKVRANGVWQDGVTFKATEVNGVGTLAASAPFIRAIHSSSSDTWEFVLGLCA